MPVEKSIWHFGRESPGLVELIFLGPTPTARREIVCSFVVISMPEYSHFLFPRTARGVVARDLSEPERQDAAWSSADQHDATYVRVRQVETRKAANKDAAHYIEQCGALGSVVACCIWFTSRTTSLPRCSACSLNFLWCPSYPAMLAHNGA